MAILTIQIEVMDSDGLSNKDWVESRLNYIGNAEVLINTTISPLDMVDRIEKILSAAWA